MSNTRKPLVAPNSADKLNETPQGPKDQLTEKAEKERKLIAENLLDLPTEILVKILLGSNDLSVLSALNKAKINKAFRELILGDLANPYWKAKCKLHYPYLFYLKNKSRSQNTESQHFLPDNWYQIYRIGLADEARIYSGKQVLLRTIVRDDDIENLKKLDIHPDDLHSRVDNKNSRTHSILYLASKHASQELLDSLFAKIKCYFIDENGQYLTKKLDKNNTSIRTYAILTKQLKAVIHATRCTEERPILSIEVICAIRSGYITYLKDLLDEIPQIFQVQQDQTDSTPHMIRTAIEHGQAEILDELLKRGARLPGPGAGSPIYAAARGGQIEMLVRLLKLNENYLTDIKNVQDSPLSDILLDSRIEMFDELIVHGASVYPDEPLAKTNLTRALENYQQAAQVTNRLMTLKILDHMSDTQKYSAARAAAQNATPQILVTIYNSINNIGQLPLLELAQWALLEVNLPVFSYLTEETHLSCPNYILNSWLYTTACGPHIEVAEKILALGADVNNDSSNSIHPGETPLHNAVELGQNEMVIWLIAHGAVYPKNKIHSYEMLNDEAKFLMHLIRCISILQKQQHADKLTSFEKVKSKIHNFKNKNKSAEQLETLIKLKSLFFKPAETEPLSHQDEKHLNKSCFKELNILRQKVFSHRK